MAEVYTRINGIPDPNVDIEYVDVWTDPNVRAKDVSFDYSYSDLTTTAPLDPGCVTNWNATCRIVVNYETHIHPLWGVDRQVFDVDGITLLRDDTCTSCHSPVERKVKQAFLSITSNSSTTTSATSPYQSFCGTQWIVDWISGIVTR